MDRSTAELAAGRSGRSRPVFLQGGPAALQGTVHPGHRGVQQAGGLGRGKRQHITQQQHRALAGWQQLDGGQERQVDAFPQVIAGLRVIGGQHSQAGVGVRLQRHDLHVGCVGWRRGGPGAEARRGGRPGPKGQAPVGGDPVHPLPQRRAVLEPAQVPPCPHQNLLHHVLGVLEGPEHPVAVHMQLVQVGGDQVRERLLIARPGQCQQPRRLRRIRAAHHPVVS
jgi:hypothetical protein